MYARYHNHGAGNASGVAEVGKSNAPPEAAIVPRKAYRQELLVNNFLAKSLTCSLCSDILAYAQSVDCGHSFCASCVSSHFGQEDTSQCPTCSKEIHKDRVAANVQLQTLVNDLAVNCTSNLSYNCKTEEFGKVPGGCGWKERMEDLPRHLAECSHQTVLCPGIVHGCSVLVWKWGLPAHMRNCDFNTECECGASLPVRELEKHKQNACIKAQVSCPHEHLGCPTKLLRPELANHLQTCEYQKLLPAFARLETKHAAEITRLKQECEVTVAGQKAYFEQELARLRKQLLASQAGKQEQRGEPKALSRGGFASRAQALGLQAGGVLQEKRKRGPYGPRKGGPAAAAKVVSPTRQSKKAKASLPVSTSGVEAIGADVRALSEAVDPSQFLQLPQDSLFQFDQFQPGKGARAPSRKKPSPNGAPKNSGTQTSPAAQQTPSVQAPAPPPSPAPPAEGAAAPPPKPVFKFAASSKPGYKTCPWTESCTKSLPHNASSCSSCGGSGPKQTAKLPAPPEQQCGGCQAMNPKGFLTCARCSAYLPREYNSNRCPSCGRGNNGNARNCGACGAELRPKRVAQYSGNTCPKCANGNNANARKCKTCGHELKEPPLVGRLKT
jgi:hypothetical protein